MTSHQICERLQNLLDEVPESEATHLDFEKVRTLLMDWDEYASWGDDR